MSELGMTSGGIRVPLPMAAVEETPPVTVSRKPVVVVSAGPRLMQQSLDAVRALLALDVLHIL